MQIRKNTMPERSADTDHSNLTENEKSLPTSSGTPLSLPGTAISDDERRHMVAEAAYFRAEKRGFCEGDVQQDWLDAEAEIKARLE